jgi:CubicO group peptidase (beta-lactamase class C family)
MKLCERGVMDLDTPLTKYTTTRFVQDNSPLDLITARRVLSHTAGLPNWRSKEQPLIINFTPGELFSAIPRAIVTVEAWDSAAQRAYRW